MTRPLAARGAALLRAGRTAGRVAPEWLGLAAAPTFAVMALLSASQDAGASRMLYAGMGSPLGGMVPMYLLMSAFHSPPWLKVFSGHRGSRRVRRDAAMNSSDQSGLTIESREGRLADRRMRCAR